MLTDREQAVLNAPLAVDFEGVAALREQAGDATVSGMCSCGCPSIDFDHPPATGMQIRVNARIRGSNDGMFLFTVGRDWLGGVEYVGVSDNDPSELPDAALLDVEVATWPEI